MLSKIIFYLSKNLIEPVLLLSINDSFEEISLKALVSIPLLLDETKFVLDTIKNYNLINMDIAELNLHIGSKNEKRKSLDNFLYLFNNYLDIKSSD